MTTADDAFEARLRTLAAEADPPPALVLEAGRAAFAMRSIDAELAELVADSWAGDAVLTRAADPDLRMLTFEVDEVRIEVDIECERPGVSRLRGVAIGVASELTIVHPGGRRAVRVLDDGSFDAGEVAAAAVRLEAETTSGGRVATSWVTT